MTLGVFVEGPSDAATIPILIKKLGYRPRIYAHYVRGDLLDGREMSNQIESLFLRQGGVTRILVFIDSEGANPQQTLRGTNQVTAELRRVAGRIPVNYIVVDHSLEGWLACDADALKAVLGSGARLPIRGNPEDDLRPAKLLERVFRANGEDFRKTVHNQRIANYVTPQRVAEKSPTFRRLADVLARIHRRTSLGTALEEASGCSSESGIMILEQKPARKQGAPNRCCHRTNPTVSASSLTTIAWWPMPACSCRPP